MVGPPSSWSCARPGGELAGLVMRIVNQLAFRVHRGDPTCRCRGQPDDPSRFRAKLGALHACHLRLRLATQPQLVEGMSAQANHDHSVRLRWLPQVRASMSNDTTAITAIPRAPRAIHPPQIRHLRRSSPRVSRSSRVTQNIVFRLADFCGMRCSTSQCSTILPSASSRNMSMPAQSPSLGQC
jgi:hypothetical protein